MATTEKTCARCGGAFKSERGYLCDGCKRPQNGGRTESRELTFREKQIVSLVSKSMQNKEIALELRLSEGTVKEYLFKIFRKVGVKNRTELALYHLRQIQAAA